MRQTPSSRRWLHLVLAFVLGAALQAPASAQSVPQTRAFAPADRIPLDPGVMVETLPNGLRYYIRQNDRPDNRVLLRLVVRAGSVDETDAQQGLAHFLEHMAFNGTKRFAAGELIAALEASGARMGPHVNAYTSFDETVYMFQLPTDREGVVDKGIQALADFAGGMTLAPAEIDKERGVVIEEWRGGLGAGSRLRDRQIPAIYRDSKYAERLPIGKPEVLERFTPAELRAFYEKWYRPDRMAVVAVGDIEPAAMAALIAREFGGLPKADTPPPPREYPVPLGTGLTVNVATDPEATQSSVSILRKREVEGFETVADYRDMLVRNLVSQMLNERFGEIARRPDAPFLGAGAFGGSLSPGVRSFTLAASVEDGKIPEGLAALALETNRVRRHGFGPAELDRARKWLLASFERAWNERDKTESGSYVQEYVNHFLLDEPSPGIEYEYRLAQRVVPEVTAGDVAKAAGALFDGGSRIVLAVAPEKPGLDAPAEADLRAAIDKSDAATVAPWADTTDATELMEEPPDPGDIAGRREIPELGVTVIRFGNGIEAWLKPTDFKNDQIVFSLVASGGTSLAPPERFTEAQLAAGYASLSGAGGHRAVDLEKLLAGRLAFANASMSLSSHGIAGSSSPEHLETALQLLHLRFTAPGDDPEAFALLKRQLDAAVANRVRNPSNVFSDRIAEVNTMGHYTTRPLNAERIAALDRSAMVSIYRERFSNAADFAFFMVGAFQLDRAIPLLAQYVGSLPSAGRPPSTFKDVGLRFPPSVERATVVKGKEPKAQIVVSYYAEPPLDEVEQSRAEAAADVLEIALRDLLREELGETYGVSVGRSQPLPQRGTGWISVGFTAAPANVDGLIGRVQKEVERLRREGPSEDLTNRVRESARRAHETELRENGYWLARLQSAHLLGRDPMLILSRLERIEGITPDALHEAFKKYFPADRYTVITLLPE